MNNNPENNIFNYEEGLDVSRLSSKSKIKFNCIECGREYITHVFNFTKPICPRCKRKLTAKSVNWDLRNKKTQKTKLQRYGDSKFVNPLQCQKTKKERYGDPYYNNPEKNKETCNNKYGVDYTFQAEPIKDKIKKTCQEKYGGMGLTSEMIAQKIKNTNLSKYGCEYGFQSEEIKNKIKRVCYKKYGVFNGGASLAAKQKMHKKYLYNGINFDSSWEVALYIYLQDNNIEFEYQPDIYFIYYYNNKIHFYYPDFKIENKYIEIKGNHFFENNHMINPFDRSLDELYNEKYKCMLLNNVKILKICEMSKYINYVNKKYGMNYIKKFKRIS